MPGVQTVAQRVEEAPVAGRRDVQGFSGRQVDPRREDVHVAAAALFAVQHRVCGRPGDASRNWNNAWHAVRALSYVRPQWCGIHAPRAHMVFADRIQIAPAGSRPCAVAWFFRPLSL